MANKPRRTRIKRSEKLKGKIPPKTKSQPEERVSPIAEDPNEKLAIFNFLVFLTALVKSYHDNRKLNDNLLSHTSEWIESIHYLKYSPTIGHAIRIEDINYLIQELLNENGVSQNAISNMVRVGNSIKEIEHQTKAMSSFTHDDINYLKYLGTYMRSLKKSQESSSAWEQITRRVEKLDMAELTMEFQAKTRPKFEFKNLQNKLYELVEKLDGRQDWQLTFDAPKKFSKFNPTITNEIRELYEEYLKINVELKKMWQDVVVGTLRASAKKFLPVEYVKEQLLKSGITIDYFPKGYESSKNFKACVGIYNNSLRLITGAGKAVNAWPKPGLVVQINPDYDSETDNMYVFKTTNPNDPDYRGNQAYTFDYQKQSQEKKFEIVTEALEDIDKYRKRWEQPILRWNPHKPITMEVLLSAQAVMIYETQARIGSDSGLTMVIDKYGNYKGKKTFGLSTWRRKHVLKINPMGIKIKYPGKKAVIQEHVLKASISRPAKNTILLLMKLIERIDKLEISERNRKEEYLWAWPGVNNGKYMTAHMFNKHLRELHLPTNFTAHKIRHAKGTMIAQQIIKNNRYIPDSNHDKSDPKHIERRAKHAADWFKVNVATQVALLLGHKTKTEEETKALWSTSVKSYIDPALVKKFFNDNGLTRVPPALKAR